MYEFVFQGPPDKTIVAPGTIIAPASGIDTVNNINYLSTGTGWKPSIPATMTKSDLLAQAAAIGSTLLYAVPGHMGGIYRVTWAAKVTTAATTSSILGGANGFQLIYTDLDDSTAVTTPTNVAAAAGQNRGGVVQVTNQLNTTLAQASGGHAINAKGATNINFSFDYTSVGGTPMAFALHIRVDYCG